jgi:hypothetical protein
MIQKTLKKFQGSSRRLERLWRDICIGFGALFGLVQIFLVEGEWSWWYLGTPLAGAFLAFLFWLYSGLAVLFVFRILNAAWKLFSLAYHAIVDAEIRRRERKTDNTANN